LNSAKSVEAAIDLNNRLTFLLDWELTMKCNLECDYCESGVDGGRDNSTAHPPVEECLRTIDFMFAYAENAIKDKKAGLKAVVLNVYGGESLHHPDIVEILQAVRDRYAAKPRNWFLKVTTTTNLIVSHRKLLSIIPLIDKFIVSYHTLNTDHQKQQFKSNILLLKQHELDIKCSVLMHADAERFADSQQFIEWCKQNNIVYFPKQLDGNSNTDSYNYQTQQVHWFKNIYDTKSFQTQPSVSTDNNAAALIAQGRPCCGGRQLSVDQNYKQRHVFVNNHFPDWYCSVDQFFLFIKQVNGDVYVNKDCKMNYQGGVGPIGNLSDTNAILQQQQQGTPVIVCKKERCLCGICAPKAEDLADFNKIMLKYQS
jgi:pyruvate-formate lyase-activating enzyme